MTKVIDKIVALCLKLAACTIVFFFWFLMLGLINPTLGLIVGLLFALLLFMILEANCSEDDDEGL